MLLQEPPHTYTSKEEEIRARALKLHHDSIVFDGHNDLPMWIRYFGFDLGMNGDEPGDRNPFPYTLSSFKWPPYPPHGENVKTHTDLARIRDGGLNAQFFSITAYWSPDDSDIPKRSKQQALYMIDAFRKQVRKYPDAIEMAYTSGDIKRLVSENKLAALLGLEGGHTIEHDISNLRLFYELGVRYMTLTHYWSHDWADSSTDQPIWNGLSAFGQKVVKEMNRLGMIVDVSHSSDKTFWDVIKVTTAPVIASHSCARAIADHPRNLTDDMIQAVADKNGVVMIIFLTTYLDPERTVMWKTATGWYWFWHPGQPGTSLSLVADHIDHVVQVAGIDHVGLGSDFDGVRSSSFLPEKLKDVGDLPNLTFELMRRGYKEEDIRKILGGNILRVIGEVEVAATRLANTAVP